MYALKVQINDQPAVVGGADDLGVLSAIVNCGGKLGADTVPSPLNEAPYFEISLGGLTSRGKGVTDEHVRWLSSNTLMSGDVVTVTIIETDLADPVISGVAAQKHEDDEQDFYEHCKKVYFSLRDKYEPEG